MKSNKGHGDNVRREKMNIMMKLRRWALAGVAIVAIAAMMSTGLAVVQAQPELAASVQTHVSSFSAMSGNVIMTDAHADNSAHASSTPILAAVVPNVLGIDEDAARNTITESGFVVGTVTQDYTCIDVAGTVLIQNPTGGSIVGLGSAVNLRVSSGVDQRGRRCVFR